MVNEPKNFRSMTIGQLALRVVFLSSILIVLSSCSSSFLKRQFGSDIEDEFSEKVQIQEIAEVDETDGADADGNSDESAPDKVADKPKTQKKDPSQTQSAKGKAEKKKTRKKNQTAASGKKAKKRQSKKTEKKVKAPEKSKDEVPQEKLVHEPADVEDGVGFIGRRPIVDPFWIGEKVVLQVTYFGVAAGYMTIEVGSYLQVNGRKHYNFKMSLRSSDVFSLFYKVDDKATTLVDYETLRPTSFQLDIQESGQVRDTRAFFDWDKLEATMWEKKYTKSQGETDRKINWAILPYVQNVFSAAYYMRTFTFKTGQEYAFRVADDGKNLLFRGKVLRREKIQTDAGRFNTIVIKPDVEMDGVLEPTGDVFFWLTDDERKMIVKIESKIKIGTIKAYAVEVAPGRKPLE